jgi:hypothetical protein
MTYLGRLNYLFGKLAFVRRETFQFLESLLSFGGKLSSFWKACFCSAGNFPVSGKLAFVRRETFQFPASLLSFGGKLSSFWQACFRSAGNFPEMGRPCGTI